MAGAAPDVVLMDLRMADGDGVEAIHAIRDEDPRAAIVAVTAFDNDTLVSAALRAGARGYLGKDASGSEMARAVLAAAHGGAVLSEGAVDRLHAHFNGAIALSEREREVLGLLERALPDREIAEALSIAVKTVEKHVGSILRKTGTQTGPRRPCAPGRTACGRGSPHRMTGDPPDGGGTAGP